MIEAEGRLWTLDRCRRADEGMSEGERAKCLSALELLSWRGLGRTTVEDALSGLRCARAASIDAAARPALARRTARYKRSREDRLALLARSLDGLARVRERGGGETLSVVKANLNALMDELAGDE